MTAAHTPQSNIEIIFSDWLDALRRRDLDALAARLAPDVTHRGVRPELFCPDRAAVLESVRSTARDLPEVEAIELVAAGENVVLSVRAPTVGVPLDAADDPGPPRGTASVVFTLHDGLITAMQDYPSRTAALRAAGAAEALWD